MVMHMRGSPGNQNQRLAEMNGQSPTHIADRSSELLQRDCISPFTQAHRQADMALVAATIDNKKTTSCFMFYLHKGAERDLPTNLATFFLAWLVIDRPYGYHQANEVIQSASKWASDWATYPS